MTPQQVLREAFVDELRKIAAEVPTRGPMRGKGGRKAQDSGDAIIGHSFGDAPTDDYSKMAEGQLHKKKDDVPSAGEPHTTEISTSKSPGSQGGGMGYAPESIDEYKNAPRPHVGDNVSLSDISTAIHQDELYGNKTAARMGLLRTDYFDAMTPAQQELVRSQLPKDVHSPMSGVLPQMASGALTGGLIGGLGHSLRAALPMAALGAFSQPLMSRAMQPLIDTKVVAKRMIRKATNKKERKELRAAKKAERTKTATPYLDELDEQTKEAVFKALRAGAGQVAKGVRAIGRKVSPSQRELTRYKDLGVGDVAEKALKKQAPAKRLQEWGKVQRQTPAQRLTTARKGATSPTEKAMLTVSGPNKAKQMAELQRTTEQIGGTSLGKRMVGAAAEGAGEHVGHRGIVGKALNPIGVPVGGAIEGAVRQMGRELGGAGHKRTGKALRRHAGKAGFVGEVGTLAGAGTALHLPLSAAGALGGKVLGAAGHAAPALESALHAGGDLLHHGAADVLGGKALSSVSRAGAAIKGGVGRLLHRAPEAAAAA